MRTLKEIMKDLSESQFLLRCTLKREGYKFFVENVLGYDVQPFHMEWIDMLLNNKRVAIEAPTGFGKTTILGEAFCLWVSYIQKGKEMCIVSKSLPQSTKILNGIKDIIENNELLKELIPKNRPLSNWCSATFMELSTGCKIFCRPYSENIKGIHVDYLLGDEVASYDDYAIWYRFVTTRVNAKDGVVVAISTSDNIADLMQELLNNPEYVGKVYKAEEPDGVPLWPKNFPIEKLKKIKSEIGLAAYEREYMNNPKAEVENAIFPPHLITECFDYDAKFIAIPQEGFTVIGCDFAIASGPRADFDAYIVVNKIGRKVSILHGETHKGFTIAAKIMRLEQIYQMFRKKIEEEKPKDSNEIEAPSTIRFVVDPSSVGQAVYDGLREKGIPVEAANFDAVSRNTMIINLRQLIENKDLMIPRHKEDTLTMTFTDKLIKELISMMETKTQKDRITYQSKAPHDDTVMALSMACKGVAQQRAFMDMVAI